MNSRSFSRFGSLLLVLISISAQTRGAEVTQTRTLSTSKTTSGTGTLVVSDATASGSNGFTGTGFTPFDPALGTLTSFTINWSTTLTASGTVSPSASEIGGVTLQIGGNFYLNSDNYSGTGGGGGNAGGPGSVINPVVATAGESKTFQVAGAGTAYNPALLTAVTGTADLSLSYRGTLGSQGNLAQITYNALSNLSGTYEGTVTLTYTYTPLYYRDVKTFAGSGSAGSTDATGTAATYNGPWGISSDALGNLYQADYTGKRIRRTTPAGVVSFIDAFTSFPPIATAIDPATGSLYVSVETHRILRYVNKNAANYPAQAPVYGPETDFPDATIVYAGTSASGSTNASGTSARFNAPHGLHARGGILYVADKGNNLIRKINLSNAAVTTVTVTGGSLSAPEAVWVAEDGTIYVACTGSDLVQKISTGGVLSTVAGSVAGSADGTGTAASFNDPRGLAMNGRGELLVADSGNHSIRRISPNGAVRTIAGNGTSGSADGAGATASFNSPRGVLIGGDGLLYITDHGNHRIRRMNVMQPLITGAPASLAAFTADYGNSSAVQSFAFAGTLLEGPITVTAPSGFEVSTDGSSYAASVTSNEGATLSIRLAATAASGSLAGNLTLASAQADTINIALSGTVAVVLQPSVGALTGFSSTVGGTSAAQSFSLTGGGFSDVVKVTAPAGYEISTDGLNFASAVTLGQPAGTIQSVLLDAAGQNTGATGAIFGTGSGSEFPSTGAFAALKSDGSVVTWGDSNSGGNSSGVAASLSSGVIKVYSNLAAFAALKNDGSVITWGDSSYGGNSSGVAASLSSGIVKVYSTGRAFAALKSDGSVITWGDSIFGGNSSSVANSLSSGVTSVYSNYYAFAALKSDGSVVSWGYANNGGSGGPANIGALATPTLPLTLHVRLAATAPSGAATGNLTISATDATTQTVALSGTVSAAQTYTHQELWRFTNFGSYDSAGTAADDADPDGDGLNNLLEYVMGSDPNASGMPSATLALNGGNLEYTYARSTAAKDAGVTYQVQWSDTLEVGSWSTQNVTEQVTSTQGALETVKASVPIGSGGKRFLRLRVMK